MGRKQSSSTLLTVSEVDRHFLSIRSISGMKMRSRLRLRRREERANGRQRESERERACQTYPNSSRKVRAFSYLGRISVRLSCFLYFLSLSLFFLFVYSRCDYLSRRSVDERENERRRRRRRGKLQIEGERHLHRHAFCWTFFFLRRFVSRRFCSAVFFFSFRGKKTESGARGKEKNVLLSFFSFSLVQSFLPQHDYRLQKTLLFPIDNHISSLRSHVCVCVHV